MILFVSRNPPNPSGPGGSQRAMHLLRSVARLGPVDFLLLYREEDSESATDTLDAVRPLVRSCQRLEIREWAPSWRRWPSLSWKMGQVAQALTLRSIEAPRFSRATLAEIGRLLPHQRYDLVFAEWLSSAWIVDDLIDRRLLAADSRIVDLCDRLAAFKQRTFLARGAREGRLRRMLQRLDIRRLYQAERDVVGRWDAVCVASGIEAADLRAETGRPVHAVPNVVDRPLLPFASGDGRRLLFVGNLNYDPNIRGLTRFLADIWPLVRAALPDCRLDVVGVTPQPALVTLIAEAGATLHADVPSVEPYYAECDLVIAPIWEGGGTRIKILEAMAYGRPVVSTAIGAEGLGLEPGVTGLIADTADAFAAAVVTLARDPALRRTIVEAARRAQVERFGSRAFDEAIGRMIPAGATGA